MSTPSRPRLRPRTRPPGLLSVLLVALLSGCDPGRLMGAASAPPAAPEAAPESAPDHAQAGDPAARAASAPVRVVVCQGGARELGAQAAAGQGDIIRRLLWLTAVRSLPARLLHPTRTAGLINAIPPAYREELVEIAAVSGVSPGLVLTANVLVDSQCSALVSPPGADAPLRVARNLDFFPASVVGPRSEVVVRRPLGRHAFVSLGWPGFAAVTSGMNDAGVTACVLLNRNQPGMRPGMPVCFRIREILERAGNLEEAVACFQSSAVASSHYVLLADRDSCALVWQGADGMHRDDPRAGWLAAANGKRVEGVPLDGRGQRLQAIAERLGSGAVSAAVMRQALTATYMDTLNAQAMVFVPARLTVEFSFGTAWHPAALGQWRSIALADLFAGRTAAPATLEELGRVAALPHPLSLH